MISLVLAALLAAPAFDTGPVSRAILQHMRGGLGEAKVGQWVTYQMDGGQGRLYFWRMSIVGEEKDKRGRDAFWVEIDIGGHSELKAPMTQLRLLVAKDAGLSKDGVTRIVAAVGYERPREMSDEAVEAMKADPPGKPEPAPGASEVAKLWMRNGKEARLMTAAGTLTALPVEVMYRGTVLKRFWVSRQVPVLHLAKLEIPAIEQTLEVRDFGVDARPRMVLPPADEPKIRTERYDEGASDEPFTTP